VLLSETGFFVSTADHKVVPGLWPHEINHPVDWGERHRSCLCGLRGDAGLKALDSVKESVLVSEVHGRAYLPSIKNKPQPRESEF